MKKLVFLAFSLLFLVALVSAYNYDSENDYYWARDYYRSSDFDSSSRYTYKDNTYHYGYEYDSFDDYKASLNYRYYPGYYRNDYGSRPSYKYNSQSRYDSSGSGRVFVKNSDYYLYHSRTFQRDYLVKCSAEPPEGSFFYIRCY